MPKLHVLSMSVVMAFIVPYGIKASTTPLELLACEKRTDENSDTPETVCGAQMNCYCGEGSFVNCSLVMSGSNIDCDTQCSSCSPSSGEYAPFENRCTSCRNATVCKANEEVDKEVTGRSDRTCRCRDWPIPRDVCELHNCTDLSCPPCPEPSSCPTPTAVEVTEQSRCPHLGPDTSDCTVFVIGFVVSAIAAVITWVLLVLRYTRGYICCCKKQEWKNFTRRICCKEDVDVESGSLPPVDSPDSDAPLAQEEDV